MTETQSLTVIPQRMPAEAPPMELTIPELIRRQELVQQCLKQVMVPGHHYGTILGTDKPTLLKPGTEKLCSLFRLSPTFQTIQRDLPRDHREYRVICTLTHQGTGMVIATGEGLCSTMESKYRWRLASRTCPDCSAEAIRKSKDGGGFYCWAKIGGCGAKFRDGDRRIIDQKLGRKENEDIADQFNTVLKMAAKRAAAAACLIATACSDMFIEDGEEHGDGEYGGDDAPQPSDAARKQQLIRECAKASAALNAPKDKIAWLLDANGIKPPEKWGDLDEATLVRVKAILESTLKEGKPL
jgi:hypothetical protein